MKTFPGQPKHEEIKRKRFGGRLCRRGKTVRSLAAAQKVSVIGLRFTSSRSVGAHHSSLQLSLLGVPDRIDAAKLLGAEHSPEGGDPGEAGQ